MLTLVLVLVLILVLVLLCITLDCRHAQPSISNLITAHVSPPTPTPLLGQYKDTLTHSRYLLSQ